MSDAGSQAPASCKSFVLIARGVRRPGRRARFGGASVLDAARFQVLVLAAILLVGVVVAVGLGAALGAPRTLPVEEAGGGR